MIIRELALEDYRNFALLQVSPGAGLNVVCGGNAQGKSNLLEAVCFCATGRSLRAGGDGELVRFERSEARLRATTAGEANRRLDARIVRETNKKGFAVDGIPIKRLDELYGLLPVVSFSPDDMRIVKAGPSERRVYMDTELCQLSGSYCHALRQYYRALKQRNKLLKAIPRERSLIETLSVWDEPLCKYGVQIMRHRADFIRRAEAAAAEAHAGMTGGAERLSLKYRPNIAEPDAYAERLFASRERDLLFGSTCVGVHKDDVVFHINGCEAKVYGSQGQQRTAALSVKLAGIELIMERLLRAPVLLLDDVLSELDESRQAYLLKRIDGLQTFLACTGVEDVIRRIGGAGNAALMRIENGTLITEGVL